MPRSPSRHAIAAALAALALMTAAGPASAAPVDVKVSDQPYVRHDGGTDPAITTCSTNNRQQNEPAAAVSPANPNLMTSGANDYCTVESFGGTWAGLYYSNDGGSTWTDSLVPGYPNDTSVEGQGSPLFGFVDNAGDPVQAWDNDGHLYYGGIAFRRTQPTRGSIWVARYDWSGGPAPDYRYTTIAARGTPSPFFRGIFHDKVMLEVDRGANSAHEGNVYVCWARFTASGPNNGVWFVRSTDGAQTFSQPQKISESIHGSQFCDIAVTSNGTVFVAWRQYTFFAERGQMQDNAAVWVKSTNGGASFSKPKVAAEFIGWDPGDDTVSPEENGQARHAACLAGDGTLGGCASPEPRAFARDCGDGPFACDSGYVFTRASTQVRITSDPTAAGDPDEAWVVFDASVPGTQTDTHSTYGTVAPGVGTQAAIYVTRTSNGGTSWTSPARIDAQVAGHQFFPDIDAAAGEVHAVWQDSRFDTASGPSGGDFRTVPISNRYVGGAAGAVSTGVGVHSFYARSSDGGATWVASQVSNASTMPQYEQFGNRDVPFFGDYNYISAAGGVVLMTWTDSRDTVPGVDPRYTDGNGTDGFDVQQCRTQASDGTWSADTCPNAGGLDQNIYGRVLP